jgi:hypothetical protein
MHAPCLLCRRASDGGAADRLAGPHAVHAGAGRPHVQLLHPVHPRRPLRRPGAVLRLRRGRG